VDIAKPPQRKHPRDLNQLAARIVGAATEEDEPWDERPDERPAVQQESRKRPRERNQAEQNRAGQ